MQKHHVNNYVQVTKFQTLKQLHVLFKNVQVTKKPLKMIILDTNIQKCAGDKKKQFKRVKF